MRGKSSKNSGSGFNETKYKVLKTLFDAKKHLTPKEVADAIGISIQSSGKQLSVLHKWEYIWRRREVRAGKRNYYVYRSMKPKGLRVFFKLDKRREIQEVTGIPVPMNFDKPIPDSAVQEYQRLGYVL